jgi:methylenetetrahydrofolate reductase (NADPH)
MVRTNSWDEFPNGRWGDSRSPAFGELTTYHLETPLDTDKALKDWGNPETHEHIR